MVDASKQSSLTLDVPVTGLKQWVDIKRQLGGVPSLKSVRLVSLTKTLAVLEVTFLGDVPQFQRALAEQDLALDSVIANKGTLRQQPGAGGALPAPTPAVPGSDPMAPGDQPAVPDQPAIPQ